MVNSIPRSPTWYRAITLVERSRLPHGAPHGDVNTDLVTRRIERWRAQDPFAEEPYFTQRLASDGLSEAEFHRLLGESSETVQSRVSPPEWLVGFAELFSGTDSSPPSSLSETNSPRKTAGFLSLVEPLIYQARARLHKAVRALSPMFTEVPFDPTTVEPLLLLDLPRHLRSMVGRTLVLELNVSRVQGRLSGETPQERFESFVKHLRQRDVALALFEEYPVLA